MPTICTSLAIASVSDLMNLPKTLMLIVIGLASMASKRAWNSFQLRILTTSVLSGNASITAKHKFCSTQISH
jgi:hypothetical protein